MQVNYFAFDLDFVLYAALLTARKRQLAEVLRITLLYRC